MEPQSLLQAISSTAYLKEAWDKLNKSNKNSRGVSSETIGEFQESLAIQIQEISKQLLNKTYKFGNVRPVLIPKKTKGNYRALRIGDIRDRLVQKALSNKLEELLSNKYKLNNPCSFAYQKDLGVRNAIQAAVTHFKNGNRIILEADIKKFFDNVNRRKLLEKVFNDLPDQTISDLIEASLAQSVEGLENYSHEEQQYFQDSIDGIPTGSSLSPLLANIYLSEFDQRMIKEKMCLVRYADDFIVLCKSTEEAKRALEIAKEELETKLSLELHPLPSPPFLKSSKTRILDPFYHEFSFLSIRFDGKKLWVNEKKVQDLLDRIDDITNVKKNKSDKDFQGLITVIKRSKNLLEGWLSSYKFVDVERNCSEIDNYINHKLLQAFIELEFKLKSSSTGMAKIKSKGKTLEVLSASQRNNTGILTCENFIKTLDRKQVIV